VAKILVIDDEENIRHLIQVGLMDHDVIQASSGLEGLLMAQRQKPDLIILDVKMPGIDGFEVCRRLQLDEETAQIPVVFATSQDALPDRWEGFKAGADDYVIKPFDLTELQFRIKAVLRRLSPPPAEISLTVGDVTLDLLSREVKYGDSVTILTPTEFTLLEYLMRHAGVLLPTNRILEEVWDYPAGVGDPALVRMHIRNLREKLEVDPANPAFIQTVGRQGYTIKQ
jgi:DNA-binding response OmpR family regulator